MKKFITLLAFFATTFSLYAQVPQAICYQAVATDTRGNELVSQSIKVRLSILKTSSTGPEEWVETHSVTTDGFGLFDLTIGSGTRTGGAQTVFSGIKWGADKYYLKVEMDVTGGTNYVLMGTNQMVSVPYALYAEKAGAAVYADSAKYAIRADSATKASKAYYSNYTDSSRVSLTAITAVTALTAKSADTTKFAWLSDSTRRAGTATTAITAITANYATTAGTARRSDTATFAWLADSTRRAALATTALTANTATFATMAGTARRSDTATFAWLSDSTRRAGIATTAITANYATTAGTARRSDTATFAWLSDSTRRAGIATTAITANYATTAGTARRSDTATFAWLADSTRRAALATTALTANYATLAGSARRSDTAMFAWLADSSRRANTAIRANVADSASRSALAYKATLADSANRSFSAVRATIADSASRAAIAYTANFATKAATANTALDDNDKDPTNEIQTMTYDTTTSTLKLSKPNGQADFVSFNSTPLRSPGASIDYPFGILGEALLIMNNYTVPAGKTLFVSAVNNPIEMADGKILNIEPGMPIIPSGQTVSSCFCSGILVDNQPYASPLIIDFSSSLYEYTVPTGKYLVIKSGTNGSRNMSFVIDGTNFDFFTGSSSSARLVVIPAGKKIRKGLTNVGSFIVSGYLLQK